MNKEHHYTVQVNWTGNMGSGTSHYTAYSRNHTIQIEHKPDLPGSADKPFRGDISKHNPEDMLLSSLSTCHMLWYLHLCADAGIIVTAYTDTADATLVQTEMGGHFSVANLHPVVTVATESMIATALQLHEKAHACCFIANSVNFPVNIVANAQCS
jgi:organic hydroperoxide reductase OsmC/OhrA